MKNYSLVEKSKILMDIILSSPLFLFCFMLGIAVLIFYIISVKKEKSINKWIFISIWAVLAVIVLINYNSIVIKLIDNLFDSFFEALYFPNLTIYIIILTISNFFFFYSIFSKKIDRKYKLLNFVNVLIIDIFLIIIIDTVKTNNINVYDELNIYSNSNLLVLLEMTSAIFVSWILLSLLVKTHNKLKKYDKKELPKMPEIVFEDI